MNIDDIAILFKNNLSKNKALAALSIKLTSLITLSRDKINNNEDTISILKMFQGVNKNKPKTI